MLLESLKKSPVLLNAHTMLTLVSFIALGFQVTSVSADKLGKGFHAEASFIKAVIIAVQSVLLLLGPMP